MLVLLYLNLADWRVATPFHPPRVGHEIVNDLVCMNVALFVICILCHLFYCLFYIQ